MKNTNDIIRSMATCLDITAACEACNHMGKRDGFVRLWQDEHDALIEMQDRCARKAEEIMVLQERLEGARKHG